VSKLKMRETDHASEMRETWQVCDKMFLRFGRNSQWISYNILVIPHCSSVLFRPRPSACMNVHNMRLKYARDLNTTVSTEAHGCQVHFFLYVA